MPNKERLPYIVIKKKYKGKDVFYLRIKKGNGKVIERTLATSSRSEAYIKAARAYSEYLLSGGKAALTVDKLFDTVYLRPSPLPLYFSFHTVSPPVQDKIQSMMRLHTLPFFGNKKVSDVTIETVSLFKTFLSKETTKTSGQPETTLSKKYQKAIWNYTKAAFALVEEIEPSLHWQNPFNSRIARNIFADVEDNRTLAFTVEEINSLFENHWKNPLIESLALFCAYTGCRVNEATALKKTDFRFRDDWVEVTISKSYSPALGATKTPKTKAGKRTVIIPRYLFDYIKPYIVWNNSSLVFSINGKSVIRCQTYSKALHEQLDKIGMDRDGLMFYSFRPFFKSYTAGALSFELSNYLMGHAESTMGEHYFRFDASVHAPLILNAVQSLPIRQRLLISEIVDNSPSPSPSEPTKDNIA